MSNDEDKKNMVVVVDPTNPILEIEADYQAYLDRLPQKKRLRIQGQQNRMQYGMHTVAPLICTGPLKCLIVEHCPIPDRDQDGTLDFGPASQYPIGQQCVVEKLFMQARVAQLQQKLQVEPTDPIEMAIVSELALLDLYKNRAAMILAKGDRDGQGTDFMRVDIQGYDENGNQSQSSKLHPVAEAMDRFEKRRERWLDRLVETRKAKLEMTRGTTQESSKILREIEMLRGSLEQMVQGEPVQLQLGTRLLLDD